jgi:crotonobetainyl-CoA:carnitine CoA-transferase CaiB-like acyl-CoA transferase
MSYADDDNLRVDRGRLQALEGVRIVDASSYVTGPMATMMLADLGADVIKVEPPGGDPYRRIRGRDAKVSVGALNVNRGKRSIVLDLKADGDRAILHELLHSAAAFVENWRPGVAARLGLGDEVLAERHPSLIHLAISGFGPDGPLVQQGAFDSLLQARTGLALLRPHEGRPATLPTYLADKVTSVFAAQSLLAALFHSDRTGWGGRIDVPMLDAIAYFNFPDVLEARTLVDGSPTNGSWRGVATQASTTVRTSDGWIAISPTSRAQVTATCEVAGHPDWVDELAPHMRYGEIFPQLTARVETITTSNTTAHWLERFEAADVPAAPVLDLDGHLADPQVIHNRIYGKLQDPSAGPVRYARHPGHVARPDADGSEPEVRPAPAPDQHRAEILTELRRNGHRQLHPTQQGGTHESTP